MASFDINPKTHKAANKQAKINNMKKSDNPNERKVADKKLTPSARVDVPKFKKGQQEEVVPGLSLVDVILGEEKCGKGMYYCYTDKKCKKLPEGLKMTARFGGGGIEPQEVGIDKPVEGGEGGNGGNGGGTSESLSIEDAFGNKFMEVVDLIKPEDIVEKKRLMNKLDKISGQLKKASALHKKQSKEVDKVSHHLCAKEVKHEEFGYGETIFGEHAIPDENGFVSHYNVQFEHGIVENVPVEDMEVLTEGSHENHEMTGDAISEKCWKGYKKKGMKTMFGKRYPNCVKANEENETVDEGIRGDDSPTNAQITKQGAERQNAVAKLMQNKEMQKRFDAAIDKKIKKEKEEQAKRMRGEEVKVDEAVRLQAEYGNLLAVVVIWRGKSLMIKMFFPQATMPKREDVQREVEKVYPGCKVTQFRRTELQSEYAPHNDPILRVQKEEAEWNTYWSNYQSRQKTLMEEVYNFADTGCIEGLDYSHWVEIEDCVLTNGNLTVDHREINMNAFQIYPEFIDTAWYVVSTDMNYIRLVAPAPIPKDRLQEAWRLAFQQCPGRQSNF